MSTIGHPTRRTAAQTEALVIAMLSCSPDTVSQLSRALSIDYSDVRALLDNLVARGLVKRIAAAVGPGSGHAPRYALASYQGDKRRVRRCLRCQREFMSAGAHNRLCEGCRRQSASPFYHAPGGLP